MRSPPHLLVPSYCNTIVTFVKLFRQKIPVSQGFFCFFSVAHKWFLKGSAAPEGSGRQSHRVKTDVLGNKKERIRKDPFFWVLG